MEPFLTEVNPLPTAVRCHPRIVKELETQRRPAYSIVFIFSLWIGLSGASCVGPAELTSGVPEGTEGAIDDALAGHWIGTTNRELEFEKGATRRVTTVKVSLELWPEGSHFRAVLQYHGIGCFGALAWPLSVDGKQYYEAIIVPGKPIFRLGQQSFRPCRPYKPAIEDRGYIIVKPSVDANGNMHLRFLSNEMLLHLSRLGHFKARWVYTDEDHVVQKYLLADLSSEDVVALLRGIPEEALFSEPVGPFVRVDLPGPDIKNADNLSGEPRAQ